MGRKVFTQIFLLCIFLGCVLSLWPAQGLEAVAAPPALCASTPWLQIRTTRGDLVFRLDFSAAPSALPLVLAQIPSREESAGSLSSARHLDYYRGLAFTYTQPLVEIRTAVREEELLDLPLELGSEILKDRVVGDVAEAMRLWQRELLPAFRQVGKNPQELTPQLRSWIEEWRATYEADFLVGVGLRQIYEALGYQYQATIQSQPARRGSLALVPTSTTRASAALAVLLQDMPARSGRWMIVGELVEGLEVAEDVSLQPLALPARRDFRPMDPVAILETYWWCSESGGKTDD